MWIILHKKTTYEKTIFLTNNNLPCSFSDEKYKQDLLSHDTIKIDKDCYELVEMKDPSAVKLLFSKILDPRISHDIRFKGMSVNYFRLVPLKKISGFDIGRKIDHFDIESAAVYFNLKLGYLKSKSNIDIFLQ